MELFFSTQIDTETLRLVEAEARHCVKVMRHKIGDTLSATDGRGNLYECIVTSIERSGGKKGQKGGEVVECKIVKRSDGMGKRAYHLTMAVCPTKNLERYEWLVEKATEFGIERLVPIISEHSIRRSLKSDRLRAIALAATKQSLKTYLPEIEEPVAVTEFIAKCAKKESLKFIAYCEEGEKKSLRQYFESYQLSEEEKKSLKDQSEICELPRQQENKEICNDLLNIPEIVVMIGPEGDFSAKEIEVAQRAGFKGITLGSSRLRVETAAIGVVSEIYFRFLS